MSKNHVSKIIKSVQRSMKKHSPEILTGIGIAGMITTAVMAVRATPKALALMDDEVRYRIKNNEQDDNENIDGLIKVSDDKNGEWGHYRLSAVDLIKTCWQCYIPATVTGTMSVICLIGASSVNLRRNAAIATAYSLSETALKEYQDKVVEVIGSKKEQDIRDSIAKDKIADKPVTSREVYLTNKGNTLCFDVLSSRYFKIDIDLLKRAVNDLNRRMRDEMFISLNDFYYEIGLDGIKLGDDLGWNIDRGYIDITFSSQLTEDDTPCLVVDYSVMPEYEYK